MQEEATKRRRRVWSKEEDEKLKILVEEKKMKNWVMISNYFRNRSNKDCRDRYFLHLSPNVVKRKWTAEEEELLMEKYKEFGSKWVKLTSFFDKRSSNDLKNRIKLIQKRKKPLRKGFFSSPLSAGSISDPGSPTSSSESSVPSFSEPIKLNIAINSHSFKPNLLDPSSFFDDLDNSHFSNDYLTSFKFDNDKANQMITNLHSLFDINSQENNTETEYLSTNIFYQ
ncbi:hypothetical protein M9Y10_045976 [Tritrichomonas musculus]|uniref:Myb-like DNA-binding domain containing protein n=1 Tax=Tritrichomonas musculus TaxID=1915356 RepID=A0ABR2JXZ8_9EUKA